MTEEQWNRPSPKLLKLRRLEVIAVAIVATAVLAFVMAIAIPAVLVLGVVVERFFTRRFRSWGYAEREDDLLVKRGVMFSRLSVIPYGRMQYIDVTAGPLERSLGLATVKMHTAAAASDARIPGLEHAEAERLRDRLAQLGEAQAAGL
jgi:uncharacterized protein